MLVWSKSSHSQEKADEHPMVMGSHAQRQYAKIFVIIIDIDYGATAASENSRKPIWLLFCAHFRFGFCKKISFWCPKKSGKTQNRVRKKSGIKHLKIARENRSFNRRLNDRVSLKGLLIFPLIMRCRVCFTLDRETRVPNQQV